MCICDDAWSRVSSGGREREKEWKGRERKGGNPLFRRKREDDDDDDDDDDDGTGHVGAKLFGPDPDGSYAFSYSKAMRLCDEETHVRVEEIACRPADIKAIFLESVSTQEISSISSQFAQ
ncbi:hypothetical protein HZH66_015257 [Vespula vulgaris]|uniref:Uncharacterized protein n=1 Tax=Vespula vulgaris TaxID=7454 RepID=A0A834MQC7_VESVU|nr:hypothetical protein HZH66_015257 [Vespula vulgaris]